MVAPLAVLAATSCGVLDSTGKFMSKTAGNVKNALIPDKSDKIKASDSAAGSQVREAFKLKDEPQKETAVKPADDNQSAEPTGKIVTEINKTAMGQSAPTASRPEYAETEETSESANVSATAKALAGEWIIIDVFSRPIETEDRPYITIDASNSMFYGSNGCNIINGTVDGDGVTTIALDNLLSTMRECQDAPYQYEINTAIPQVRFYSVVRRGQESYLTLCNSNNQPVMTLRKCNLDYLNGAWTPVSINGEPVEPGKITMSIDLPELRVHGNAGCNIINGELYVDHDKPNSLQFGQMATTRMTCPDIQLEMNFLLTLEGVESCACIDADNVTLYDEAGEPVMTLRRITIDR